MGKLRSHFACLAVFGTAASAFPSIGFADPSSISICDDPRYRGSAEYNHYCVAAPDSPPSTNGYEAAQRAAEAQRAQEAAEAERRQEEARRRALEEAERQANFIRERDDAASTLKGSTGLAGESPKGSGFDNGVLELKGSSGSAVSSLRGGSPALDAVKDKQRPCPPVQDASTVDACNVPPGLTKSVGDAISAAYADAPPGVIERVRKGFQAVMHGDWPVAKAWFADALNHDPGNVGLKRLLALANYSKAPDPTATRSSSATEDHAATLGASLDAAMDAQLNQQINEFLQNELPKHPELRDASGSSASSPDPKKQSGWDKLLRLMSPRRAKQNSAIGASRD